MDVSLYQAAAAMNATARWQDLIAENLSAASVPGARKQEMSFSDVQAGMAPGTSGTGYYLPSASVVTNTQPGELRSTSNPLDFALEGPGFFTVQMGTDQNVYTRDGEFKLNAQGELVTKGGYPVMGQAGPLHFNPNSSATITMSATGEVSQGDQPIGKLNSVEFQNPGQLTMRGSGFFSADDPANPPTPATVTKVRQGFVEAGNTSPTTEMASLITAMRMFEANQKVLQMQGDRMSRVITDLGGSAQG